MKKLLALLLSMVMALSLAVPAFADGPGGPPSPEDIYGWTVEDEWNAVCEEYPEDVAVFQKEVKTWFARHASWYDAATFEQFVEEVGGEEAAYLSLFYEWKWEREDELARNEVVTALGGVPGQIGVMVNGKYVAFPDAVPEVTGGRTMTPVRAVVEALGGEVDVSGRDIRCRLDGVTVVFTIGSREAVVELDADAGEGGERVAGVIDMGCAPYIKGGRTYVPVRFLGEALEYIVGWESDYQTAVLMDPEALVAGIDEKFTILNRALANLSRTVEEGKNYLTEMKGEVAFTAFDTLNGNTTYQAGFTGSELMDGEAANGTYTVTMSGNMVDALMEMLMGTGWDEPEYEEDAALLRSILEGLEGIEVIATREGLYWAHLPVLDELGGGEDIWCAVPVDPDAAAASFAGGGVLTMGQLVAASAYSDSLVTVWGEAMGEAERLAAIWGDGCFTTGHGVSTLAIGLDDLDGEVYQKEDYKEFKLTLEVDEEGAADLSFRFQTAPGRPGMRLTVDGSLSSGRMSVTVECHISNTGELKLTLSSQRRTTTEKPVAQPPEGADIVDAGELLGA